MSFAADLKEFVSSFRDTYKTFKPSWQEQSLAEQRALREAASAAGDAGEASAGRDLTRRGAVDTGDTPSSGYNPKGKAPTFTSMRFNTDAPKLIADLQTEVGLPQHAAEGFVGRLGAETGGFSTLQETSPTVPGSRGGFGFAQWTGSRRRAFENYVAANKLDPASYEANKGFLIHELKNTGEGRVLNALRGAKDAQQAGSIVERQFLRPGVPHGRRGIGWVERAKQLGPLPRRAALDLGEDDPALLEEQPVVYAARGGVVPSTIAENAGSNPVTRDVMDAEASEADDDYDPTPLVDVEGARRAVEGGLRFGQRMLGLEAHHAAVPGAVQPDGNALKGLAHSVGAASPDELKVLDKTIDPKGKLPPEVREIARYNAQYQFWNKMGEPQKADRAAWSMLSAAKRAASQYGAAALAIEDPKKRAEVIAQGYNRLVPDGNTMKVTGSSPQGVKFEIVDPSGKLTEKGSLAVDDMVELATGMVNGTQWLQSMINFATSAPTAAEKKDAKNQAAIAQYDAEDDTSVVASMTPNQREALNKMTPDVRARAVEARRKALKMEYTEEQDALKRDDKIENRDYQRDWQKFKTALAQNNFDVKRHDVLTNAEKKFFLYEKDLDDRNKRFDQSQEARKHRDAARAESLLQSRVGRAAAQGIKLTAKEAAENRRVGAIDTAEGQARMAIAGEGQEGNEFGYGAGPSPEQETRMGAISAEAGFNRIPEANRKFDDADYAAIRTGVDKMFGETKVNPADKLWASRIASDIRRAGDFSNDDAVMMVQHALDPKSPEPRVNPRDGTVSFGANLPPVKMTADSVMALAQLRGRARAAQAPKEPKPTVRQAIPGATAPVRTTPEDDARARAANRRRAIETWGAPAR